MSRKLKIYRLLAYRMGCPKGPQIDSIHTRSLTCISGLEALATRPAAYYQLLGACPELLSVKWLVFQDLEALFVFSQKRKIVWKLVLTGGPCGGKTTGQARLSTFFENLGWKVYRVPETANILLSGGVNFNELSPEAAEKFQVSRFAWLQW